MKRTHGANIQAVLREKKEMASKRTGRLCVRTQLQDARATPGSVLVGQLLTCLSVVIDMWPVLDPVVTIMASDSIRPNSEAGTLPYPQDNVTVPQFSE